MTPKRASRGRSSGRRRFCSQVAGRATLGQLSSPTRARTCANGRARLAGRRLDQRLEHRIRSEPSASEVRFQVGQVLRRCASAACSFIGRPPSRRVAEAHDHLSCARRQVQRATGRHSSLGKLVTGAEDAVPCACAASMIVMHGGGVHDRPLSGRGDSIRGRAPSRHDDDRVGREAEHVLGVRPDAAVGTPCSSMATKRCTRNPWWRRPASSSTDRLQKTHAGLEVSESVRATARLAPDRAHRARSRWCPRSAG